MAKVKKIEDEVVEINNFDFTTDLIKTLNKEMGERVAYNLATDDAPTMVKRWISTGSQALDYIISNRRDGGIPEGRITEIFGAPSGGKSHLALQVARNTQRMGGMVVYIDSENGTSVQLLGQLGIDVKQQFVYVEESCTETVFGIIEKTILKAREVKKDIPIVIIWDSVAACSPKAELLGEYDKDTIGLQARQLAKGFRKITQIIADSRATLLCCNQMKTKIGVMFGDPDTTPGGMALPFHASVRIKLTSGLQIKGTGDKADEVIGIKVIATTLKNKVASPRRKTEFEIHFGIGINERETLFDACHEAGSVTHDHHIITCGGTSTWKYLTVVDTRTGKEIIKEKFVRAGFDRILTNESFRPYINILLDKVFIRENAVLTLMSELEAEEELMLATEAAMLQGDEAV